MAKGYWIVRIDVADPEKYKAYLGANVAAASRNWKARAAVAMS